MNGNCLVNGLALDPEIIASRKFLVNDESPKQPYDFPNAYVDTTSVVKELKAYGRSIILPVPAYNDSRWQSLSRFSWIMGSNLVTELAEKNLFRALRRIRCSLCERVEKTD
jgi:hypothetical protein